MGFFVIVLPMIIFTILGLFMLGLSMLGWLILAQFVLLQCPRRRALLLLLPTILPNRATTFLPPPSQTLFNSPLQLKSRFPQKHLQLQLIPLS